MDNIQSWRGVLIKIEGKEVETTTETKPKMKAQIPFLADLIKMEQQSMKSKVDLNNVDCSSWVCKDEIINEDLTYLGKNLRQPGPYVEDNKIHIKDELSSGNVPEMKSQCYIQHSQLIGHNNFSDTLSEQARNIEQIKEKTEDSEIIDGHMAETTENRDLLLSITPRGQGGNEFSGKAFGNGACSKLSDNNFYVSKKRENCDVRSDRSEKLYKCDNGGGNGYSKNRSLIVHKTKYTGEKPYKCDVCGKAYIHNSILTVHKRTHTGEKPYKCDVCGKGYYLNGKLTLHKRTHTGEKPYKCDVCGKEFITNTKLKIHKRTHTEQKPYKCDVCGKEFITNTKLTIHKRTHTGEKPYKCDVCGKGYSQSGNMFNHKRIHTGEKPYKCDVCGKGCKEKSELKSHKRTHTGEKPFKCDMCGKSFAKLHSLKKHMRSHQLEKLHK